MQVAGRQQAAGVERNDEREGEHAQVMPVFIPEFEIEGCAALLS